MSSLFGTVASLEYNRQTGQLPSWVFPVLFIVSLTFFKIRMMDDFETGKKIRTPWWLAVIMAIGVTFVAMFTNWIAGGMFKARTNVYRTQGYNNITARNAALRASQRANLNSKISATSPIQ
jgi:hypothetical protein